MNSLSIIFIVATYPATYGHTSVINSLCQGLTKLGHRTAIGAFNFKKDPPKNHFKKVYQKNHDKKVQPKNHGKAVTTKKFIQKKSSRKKKTCDASINTGTNAS